MEQNNIKDIIPEDFKPRIRPVETIPFEHEGQTLVMLQDPHHICEETLMISPVAGLIVSLFNGSLDLEQIQQIIKDQCNIEVATEDIYQLSQQLDEKLLLESEHFNKEVKKLVQDFRDSPVRKAFLENKSYPGNREELEQMLDSFFSDESGPGLPFQNGKEKRSMVKGAIIPHIDIRSGGLCFAWAYHRIFESELADIYIILGTGHTLGEHLFSVTDKTFETVLGEVKQDSKFISKLNENFGSDLTEHEIYHRTEHVIEFQAIFLQYILGKKHDFKIVPVLCSYSPSMAKNEDEEYSKQIENFSSALKKTIEESGKKVCIISSVDFAHMGPRYGDEKPLQTSELRELDKDDHQTIQIISSGDQEKFTENLYNDEDNQRRRICGYPCIHTMLSSMDLSQGELLKYDQTQIDDSGSIVSFSSMVFHE